MTQPPGDSWGKLSSQPFPASASPSPAPALDAWGRPLLEFDPAANRAALERATARLRTWLGVLWVVFLVGGVASALALYLGVQAGLRALAALDLGFPLPGSTWLLGLAALLVLTWTAIYLGVIGWARELISRLGRWALSGQGEAAPDAGRIERLRRTLSGWLTFGQWGAVVGVVLSAVSVPLTLTLMQRLIERYDPSSSADFSDLGPGFVALQTGSTLVSSVPGVVIVCLILAAIRRLMTLAAQRARGLATPPATPAAKTVGNWFLFCLILLGLQALYLVGAGVALAIVLPLARQGLAEDLPQAAQAWIGVGAVLGGLLVYSALVLGLYFALLLFSRTYALALARQLDLPPSRPAAPLGVPAPGEGRPAPNIYRGPA